MKLLDIYYRAYMALRKHTLEDSNSQKLRKTIAHANSQNDILTAIKYECTIEEDWISNIEEGLIYVEKAIREDRQFIRTEGEVVPIEKVKKVSRTSIEHLSKHSDYITREPLDGADLIPDKLYIVEKLNDYLVYENRFIYMLLCYLKDFIQIRLDDIKDKTTSYQSTMKIHKTLDENQKHLHFELNYDDLYKNDPLLVDQYENIPFVNRIETIYATAVALLATPLMKEVAKAPMIKPPVVKTNVLRMNQNFRASLNLYDFITSYTKKGYTFKEIKKTFNPFSLDFADDMAETIQLTSILSYVEGNNLKDNLKKRFNIYENELIESERKKALEEIKRLKKRISELQEDPTHYMVKLEKRNTQLEKDSTDLYWEKEKNQSLTQTIESLENEKVNFLKTIEKLNISLSEKDEKIEVMQQKYYDDMTQTERLHQHELKRIQEMYLKMIDEMKAEHAKEVSMLHTSYQEQINDLKNHYEEVQKTLIQQHNQEKLNMQELFDQQKKALIQSYEEKMEALDHTIAELKKSIETLKQDNQKEYHEHELMRDELTAKIRLLEDEIARLDEEKKYAKAQYLALKNQRGLITNEDDFTSKERFKELELEMMAYKKLFKEQWKKTKVKIREKVKEDIQNKEIDKSTSSSSTEIK